MEAFLPDSVKLILLGLIAVVFVLSQLARALPHIGWLQVFRLPTPELSEEEKNRRRRAGNRLAALEIMVLGLALPLVYFVATVMMFNDFETLPLVLVSAATLSCFAAGIWIYARNR